MRVPLLAAVIAVLVMPAGSASAATFNVTKTGDDTTCTPGNCSLRGAIVAANADPDADTINVPAGTYQLTIVGDEDDGLEGDLDVRHPTTINGAGASATIVEQGDDGGEPIQDRIFDVQPQAALPCRSRSATSPRGADSSSRAPACRTTRTSRSSA